MNNQIDGQQLISFIERIEHLNDEAASIAADIKEVLSEAKSSGYDPKMIKWCVKMRKMDKDEIEELSELEKMYSKAIGL
jgi:uncharacterized protein (UPF0335 family)